MLPSQEITSETSQKIGLHKISCSFKETRKIKEFFFFKFFGEKNENLLFSGFFFVNLSELSLDSV